MLNDNFLFSNHINVLPGRYYQNFSPFDCDDFEREYLAEIDEHEQRRRYQVSPQEQAYLKALEQRRQNRIEEDRQRKKYQYLLELKERKKLQELEQKREQQRRQQYLAHLEQRRQEQLEKQIRNEKVKNLRAKKRNEEMRKHFHSLNQINPLQRIIEGPDGNLYRVLSDSTDPMRRNQKTRKSGIAQSDEEHKVSSSCYRKPQHSNYECFANSHSFDNVGATPSDQQVNIKECSSINQKSEGTKQKTKKTSIPKKHLKSSILIGDVEDASDSECEDEYNDYMHTRRPQAGQWIEPIECFGNSKAF